MKNGKPSNLFPLLKAVKHPFGDNQKHFEMYFCHGQLRDYGRGQVWDVSGSSNLPVLHQHIASHVIYLTKADCAMNLPDKSREIKVVPVSNKFQLRHTDALNKLVR